VVQMHSFMLQNRRMQSTKTTFQPIMRQTFRLRVLTLLTSLSKSTSKNASIKHKCKCFKYTYQHFSTMKSVLAGMVLALPYSTKYSRAKTGYVALLAFVEKSKSNL